MVGTITALKVQQRNKTRVNIFLDDVYALSVPAMLAMTLKKGQHLTDAHIEQLKAEDEWDKAYNQAVRYLGYRPCSHEEVVRYLAGKGYPAEMVTKVADRLVEQNYLNDESFARMWVEERERFKPKSALALRQELRQKGVNDQIIQSVVDDLDEPELAWSAIENKIYQWQNLDPDKFAQKVLGYLARRGFNYEIARQALERARSGPDAPEQ
jgi:regulatory protein